MEGNDAEALKKASERLSQVAMKIGEQMYKAQQQAEAGAKPETAQTDAGPRDEKVVDAEFEEVDDKKKSA
jgi:molecular chaperone DnaK